MTENTNSLVMKHGSRTEKKRVCVRRIEACKGINPLHAPPLLPLGQGCQFCPRKNSVDEKGFLSLLLTFSITYLTAKENSHLFPSWTTV